jgi:putative aldouronate transport system permease protein
MLWPKNGRGKAYGEKEIYMKNMLKKHAGISRSNRIRQSRGDILFDVVNVSLLLIITLIFIIPLLNVVSVSLTSTASLYKYGKFQLFPREISLNAYKWIVSNDLIPRAFLNSVIITVLGTVINMVLTTLGAYPLSVKNLPGRKLLITFVTLPLLFSGGLIPLFIVVKTLGIMDSYWAVVLPWAIWVWFLLIMKSYMEGIPEELIDAARIDGANDWKIFTKIILPLSKPVLASLTLFYAVGNWNNFFLPLMFINSGSMKPLPIIIRDILIDALRSDPRVVHVAGYTAPSEAMKMAAVVISLIPLVIIYPWLQRYFTKGMLLGSLKG